MFLSHLVCVDVYFCVDAVRIACGAVFFYPADGTAGKISIRIEGFPFLWRCFFNDVVKICCFSFCKIDSYASLCGVCSEIVPWSLLGSCRCALKLRVFGHFY